MSQRYTVPATAGAAASRQINSVSPLAPFIARSVPPPEAVAKPLIVKRISRAIRDVTDYTIRSFPSHPARTNRRSPEPP